jgi:hypothetical protein
LQLRKKENMSDQNPAPTPTPTETPPAAPLIDESEFTRARQEAADAKAKALALQKEIDDMKVNTHKNNKNWQEVARINEEKAKEYETKYSGLKESLIQEKKVSALIVEAQKHGINPQSIPDLELLDFPEISVETTSNGRVLVSGADRAVSKLKQIRPHWFTQTIPAVNPSSPELNRPSGGLITLEQVNAAQEKWAKTKSDADKKSYFDIIQKFKSQ